MREQRQNFDALVFSGKFWIFRTDTAQSHRDGLCAIAQERQFSHLGVHKTAWGVAVHGIGQIGQAVFNGIVCARCRCYAAGKNVALDTTLGVVFQQVAPFFLGHGSRVCWWQPAGDCQNCFGLNRWGPCGQCQKGSR